MHPGIAALSGLVGNFILSLGMVLQKRNIGWIEDVRKGKFKPGGKVLGWGLGLLFINIVPVFNYIALLGLGANVVSALIGANVVFTALLSSFILKEGLGRKRALWSALLFAALALAGFRGEGGVSTFNVVGYYAFLILPLVAGCLAVLAFARKGGGRGVSIALAVISGSAGGYLILSMRALQLSAGTEILRWIVSPYLYFYMAGGAFSFVLIQMAYKDGEMLAVSPAFYGMQVLWPALASYAVLGAAFDPLQALAFAAIALAVFMVARSSPSA